jgi:hypothetical protein
MATLTISEQTYQKLQHLAQQQGKTPEALIETWVEEQEPQRVIYQSEEELMRALGLSEADIASVMAEPVEPEPGEEYETDCFPPTLLKPRTDSDDEGERADLRA